MIADAIAKVGPDGVLSIESSNGLETTVEVEEGLEIDRGYISPQFVNNQERSLVELENVRDPALPPPDRDTLPCVPSTSLGGVGWQLRAPPASTPALRSLSPPTQSSGVTRHTTAMSLSGHKSQLHPHSHRRVWYTSAAMKGNAGRHCAADAPRGERVHSTGC